MLLRTCLKLMKQSPNFKRHSLLQDVRLSLNADLGSSVRVICSSHTNLSRLNDIQQVHKQVRAKRIYNGVLAPQIKAVKVFSLSSSIVGLIAQPFLYKEIATMGNIPVIVAVYSCIGFFTFVTPLLLHIFTKKYVTHLDYRPDKDTYVANTVNFFCMTRETEFKVEDVHVPDVPGLFTTFIAKKKALFIDPNFFDSPDHYARLMGYDKPIDFKLNETNTDSSSTSGGNGIKNKT